MWVRGGGHTPAVLPPVKYLITIVQDAGWASGQVCKGAENFAGTGIRSWAVQPEAV